MSAAMPTCSISASTPDSGCSTSASRRCEAPSSRDSSSVSTSARSSVARARSISVLLGGSPSSPSPSRVELAVVRRVDPQLALEVAQRQVGQVVGALVGLGQVGRERGVDPRRRPSDQPCAAQRQQRRLGVVDRPWAAPGRPARRRPRARRPRPASAGSNQAAGAVAGGHRDRRSASPVPRPNVPVTATPTGASPRRASASQPATCPAPSTAPARSKPDSASGSTASR